MVASRLWTTFLCPLCRAGGHTVLLDAELQRDGELLVVAEVAGCIHADGFGDPEQLTLSEEWCIITAALNTVEPALLLKQ